MRVHARSYEFISLKHKGEKLANNESASNFLRYFDLSLDLRIFPSQSGQSCKTPNKVCEVMQNLFLLSVYLNCVVYAEAVDD